MSRFQIVLIGTILIIVAFSLIIYVRVLPAPYAEPFISVLIWQTGVWGPWVLFGQILNKFDHRHPIVEQPIPLWIARHGLLCFLILTIHAGWFFIISSNFSPFLEAENTRYGAFLFFFIMWTIIDFLYYWLLLGVFALRQLLGVTPEKGTQHDNRPNYLLLKTTGRQSSVAIDNIEWIEAEDYCCRVHTNDENYLVRQSLSSFEETLPKEQFSRVHRSTIVRLNFITSIEKAENSKYLVRLKNDVTRPVSKDGRKKIEEFFNRHQFNPR